MTRKSEYTAVKPKNFVYNLDEAIRIFDNISNIIIIELCAGKLE